MASVEELLRKEIYQFKPFNIKQLVPKTSLVPKGRSGHRIVSDDACVYSFGGFNPHVYIDENLVNRNAYNSKLFKELWKFNISKREWEKLDHYSKSMPKQLASNAVLKKGNSIIVHGGTGIPFGVANTNKTYIADLKSSTPFSIIPAQGNYPTGKYGQAMVLDGHCLYVVGGTNGFDYSVDVHCLNLVKMVWEEKYLSTGVSAAEPQGRYRHEIALHNSRIMILGGGTDTNAFGFEYVPAFNLETGTWETIKTYPDKKAEACTVPRYPPARRCHGCIQIPGDENQDPEVVICGGFDGVHMFSDMWRLNLRTLDWSKCECMLPYPLYFHSTSVSPNGQMFLFGGICENLNDRENYATRTNEIFSLWAVIPKLKEMCWEAILHYCPNLSKCTNLELMQVGVPIDLIERMDN